MSLETVLTSRTNRAVAAVVGGAVLASVAAGATASAAPVTPSSHHAVSASSASKLSPTYVLTAADIIAVAGDVRGPQVITLRGRHPVLSPGVVVTATPGGATPDGLLAHVLSSREIAGRTVLHTRPARLNEVLAAGHYTHTVSLAGSGGQWATVRGIRPDASTSTGGITFPLKQTFSCSGSVTSSSVTGSLSIRPSVEVSLNVGFVTTASAIGSINESASLRASLTGSATCKGSLPIALVTLPLFWIGPIPITATVALSLDESASVNGAATLSGSQSMQGSLGVRFTSAGTNHLQAINSGSSSWNVDPPQLPAGKLEAGLTAFVGVGIVGVLNAGVKARGYIGVTATSGQTPRWRAYDGAGVAGTVNLFGTFNVLSVPIWSQEWTAALASGPLTHTIRNPDGSWDVAGNAAGQTGIPDSAVSVAAASSSLGTAQFIVAGSDGRLWHMLRNPDGTWGVGGNAAAAAGIPGSAIDVAAVSATPGAAQFAVVTSDGRLWHTVRNPDGSWTRAGDMAAAAHIPGTVVSVAAAAGGGGTAEFLVVTGDGRLWHTVRNADGSWDTAGNAAADAGIPGSAVSATAVATSAGVVQFAVVTSDGRLWHTIRNVDGSWTPAGDLAAVAGIPGQVLSVSAASSSAGVAQFLVATSDGRLWHTIRNADGSWIPAGDAGGAADIPGPVLSSAAVSTEPGEAQFLTVD